MEAVRIVNRGQWDKLEIGLRMRAKIATAAAADAMRDAVIDGGQELAWRYLDIMVYNAPLPASSLGREAWYVRTRRTRHLRDAIKTSKGREGTGSMGKLYVDEEEVHSPDHRGYFYAVSVEFGVASMDYYARPFFRATLAAVRIKFAEEAALAGRRIVREIIGEAR